MTYLNLLVAHGRLKQCSLAFLRKSHTHCRIGTLKLFREFHIFLVALHVQRLLPPNLANSDQLWGIISRRVAHESSLQNTDDVAAAISHELSKPTIRDWVGPTTRVQVRQLHSTHDWRSHLPSLGIKLEGGLLKDESANHLFLSMPRQGSKNNQFNCQVGCKS